jgi:hypothetical protein
MQDVNGLESGLTPVDYVSCAGHALGHVRLQLSFPAGLRAGEVGEKA